VILTKATLAKAATYPPQTRRLGFAEGVAASFELETHEGSSTGPSNLYQKAVTRSLQGLSKLMGSGGELPGVGTAPWGAYEVGVHLRRLGDATDQILAAREAGVPGAESIQTLDEVQAEARAETNRLRSRAEGASGVASLVGGLGAGISDPAVLLTLPFGASAGMRTLTAVLSEAGINAGLELAIQEPVQQALRDNGIEPSATAVERALMAGVGAAGFTAVGRGLVGLLNRSIERGAMRNRSALAAAADDVIDMVTETERNPLRDAGPHGERAHLEALGQAGADASAGRVPFTERITLRSQLAREYADLAREIGGDAPRAVEPLARPGSGRGLMRHALDTLRGRGIEAELVRGTEIDTLRFRVGDGERVVEVPRDANAFEARAAIDAATKRAGESEIPPTQREIRAAPFVEPIENLKKQRRELARTIAHRTVDGVVVDDAGAALRAFESREAAEQFAASSLPGEWEAVSLGGGQSGLERIPVSNAPRVFSDRDRLGRRLIFDPSEVDLDDLAGRIVDGVMLDRGVSGKVFPFKTKAEAEGTVKALFRGDAGVSIQKVGRGYGIVGVVNTLDDEILVDDFVRQGFAKLDAAEERLTEGGESLRGFVKRRGGLDSFGVKRHSSHKTLVENGLLGFISRKGTDVDQMILHLRNEGLVPPDYTPDQLFDDLVANRRMVTASGDDIAEARYRLEAERRDLATLTDALEEVQRAEGRPLTVGEATDRLAGTDVLGSGGYGVVPAEPSVAASLRRALNEVNDTPVDYDDVVAAQVAQERVAAARRAAEVEELPEAIPDEDPFANFDPDTLPEDLNVAIRELDASGREVFRSSPVRDVVNRLQAAEEYLRCRLG